MPAPACRPQASLPPAQRPQSAAPPAAPRPVAARPARRARSRPRVTVIAPAAARVTVQSRNSAGSVITPGAHRSRAGRPVRGAGFQARVPAGTRAGQLGAPDSESRLGMPARRQPGVDPLQAQAGRAGPGQRGGGRAKRFDGPGFGPPFPFYGMLTVATVNIA